MSTTYLPLPFSATKSVLNAVSTQSQFKFELPDLKQSFSVLRFRGSAALSHNYSYRIHVESASPIDGTRYDTEVLWGGVNHRSKRTPTTQYAPIADAPLSRCPR